MTLFAGSSEIEWHNDGHVLGLRLNKDSLEVSVIKCPGGDDRKCGQGDFCVVDYFVTRWGLEPNIGVCSPAGELEICWTIMGDVDDPDMAQVWYVPIDDEVFHAWMVSRSK